MSKKCVSGFLLVLGLCVFLSGTAFAAQWAKVYGGSGEEWGVIYPTTNGNFYLYGETTPVGGHTAGLFAKLKSTGGVSWAKKFGGVLADDPLAVEDLTDGSFFAGGPTGSYGTGNPTSAPNDNIVFAKYTSSWAPVFQKVFGGAREESGWFGQTSDGGFLFRGTSNSFSSSAGDTDMLFFKIDPSGNLIWKKAYSYNKEDSWPSVEEASDGFLVSADASDPATFVGKIILAKLNKATGAVIWKKLLSTAGDSLSSAGFFKTMDGNYILSGTLTPPASPTNPIPNSKALLIKINPATGGIVWSKTYGSGTMSVGVYPVAENSDGSLILSGSLSGFDMQTFTMAFNPLVMKINSTGSTISLQKKYNGSGLNMAGIHKTPTGEILLSGMHAASSTSVKYDVLYGKLNPTTFDPVWVKTFGGADADVGGLIKTGTKYMLSGDTSSFGPGTPKKGNILGMVLSSNGDYAGCSYVKPFTLSVSKPGLTVAATALTQTTPALTSRTVSISPTNISLPVSAVTLPSGNICPAIAAPEEESADSEEGVEAQ